MLTLASLSSKHLKPAKRLFADTQKHCLIPNLLLNSLNTHNAWLDLNYSIRMSFVQVSKPNWKTKPIENKAKPRADPPLKTPTLNNKRETSDSQLTEQTKLLGSILSEISLDNSGKISFQTDKQKSLESLEQLVCKLLQIDDFSQFQNISRPMYKNFGIETERKALFSHLFTNQNEPKNFEKLMETVSNKLNDLDKFLLLEGLAHLKAEKQSAVYDWLANYLAHSITSKPTTAEVTLNLDKAGFILSVFKLHRYCQRKFILYCCSFPEFQYASFNSTYLKTFVSRIDKLWRPYENVKRFVTKLMKDAPSKLLSAKSLEELESVLYFKFAFLIQIPVDLKNEILKKINLFVEKRNYKLDKDEFYTFSLVIKHLMELSPVTSQELDDWTNLWLDSAKHHVPEKELLYLLWGLVANASALEVSTIRQLFSTLIQMKVKIPENKEQYEFTIDKINTIVKIKCRAETTDESVKELISVFCSKNGIGEYKLNESTVQSKSEKKIESYLKRKGVLFRTGEVINSFSVDFVISPRTILEYYGSSHYYFETKEIINMHASKIWILQSLGYEYKIIPYFEWNNLEGANAQEKYLDWRILQS